METKFESARFVSWNSGEALIRNFDGAEHNWRLLNNTGKWQDGTVIAARFLFNGEPGFEDITLAEARALAAKLGGSLENPT